MSVLEASSTAFPALVTCPDRETLASSVACDAAWMRGILIVIPTFNEASHIEAVVEKMVEEIPESADARVVVVDGGSTDGTQQIVTALVQRYPVVRCLHNLARIQSAGINLALRDFGRDAEVLIRCDAHATYPDRYCERLLGALSRSGADAVVVAMDSVGHTPLQRAMAWVSNSIVGTGGSAHRAGHRSCLVDHGHHAAFLVDTFRRVGGYDETFSHNEDAEFDCRQRALGAKVYLDADIRVQYCPRAGWGAVALQYYRYGVGRSRTLRRHPQSIRLRQLVVPVNLVACGLAAALCPWYPALLVWPAAYLMGLAATSIVQAVRHGSVDGLLAGPIAGLMHTAWAVGLLSGWCSGSDRQWLPQMVAPMWGSSSPGAK